MLAYLDHNIWDWALKRGVTTRLLPDCDILISTENMTEAIRSQNSDFLSLFAANAFAYAHVALQDMRYIEDRLVLSEQPDWQAVWQFLQGTVDTFGRVGDGFLGFVRKLHGGLKEESARELIHREVSSAMNLIAEMNADELAWDTRLDELNFEVIPDELPGALELRKALRLDSCRISNYPPERAVDLIWQAIPREVLGSCTQEIFFGMKPLDLQGYSSWPVHLQIAGMYGVLNMVGYRSDKQLAKHRRARASQSDASHVGFGAFANILVTGDQAMGAKAKAIYSKLGISTEVIMPE